MTRKLAFGTLEDGTFVYFTSKSACFVEAHHEVKGCGVHMMNGKALMVTEPARLMLERIWPEDQKPWELQQTLRPK